MPGKPPVLWHIKISHYNEKVRWALDYKHVPHKRRAPLPLFGTLPTAWIMTRGTNFPILRIDRRSIADSTAIIAELEARYPEPPLYPADPAERAHALELEDFFDEQLAPQIRLLGWYESMKDPPLFLRTAIPGASPVLYAALRPGAPVTVVAVRKRYGATEDNAAVAREKIVAAMERVQDELGPSGYLVGDRFSVADLTAAALFTPLLLPPERQYAPTVAKIAPLQKFADEVRRMPGADWVFEMFRRHRGVSAEIGAAA